MIYFTTIIFNKDVHVQALGFTKMIYDYVEAETPEQGALICKDFYQLKYAKSFARWQTEVVNVKTTPALNQNIESYIFGVIQTKEMRFISDKWRI